jgi:hypothetical protein
MSQSVKGVYGLYKVSCKDFEWFIEIGSGGLGPATQKEKKSTVGYSSFL